LKRLSFAHSLLLSEWHKQKGRKEKKQRYETIYIVEQFVSIKGEQYIEKEEEEEEGGGGGGKVRVPTLYKW
jgi:hypothetical protein